jgi:hypothetical protein
MTSELDALAALLVPIQSNLLVGATTASAAMGVNVLGLVSFDIDSINCIKQSQEFGLTNTMRIAALAVWNPDVRSIGLELAQGMTLTERLLGPERPHQGV